MTIDELLALETLPIDVAMAIIKYKEQQNRRNGMPACSIKEYNLTLKAIRTIKESGINSPEIREILDIANTFLLNVGAIKLHTFNELFEPSVMDEEDNAYIERMDLINMEPLAKRKSIFSLCRTINRKNGRGVVNFVIGYFSTLQYATDSMQAFILQAKSDAAKGKEISIKGYSITEHGVDYILTVGKQKSLSVRKYDNDGHLIKEWVDKSK